jgi:3-deoxy-D-manno-octulosonic-acid transferase
VLVDGVGVLGELYALAEAAYVGGGYGTAGIHSVLEPAAFGAPVLFGPRHANAREAAALVAAGGGFEAEDAEALARSLAALADQPDLRRRAGEAARACVRANLGAAARGAEIVDRLLG